jgi:GTPase Era involved in 16S rRNA processing
MSARPLRIAVVGHTNTGKTSLVRTLMHDRGFGEVRDRGGTTRRITRGELVTEGGDRIELFDSPGLENAPELIEWLDAASERRHDGPERIRHLLDHPQAAGRFDHETRVLGLMLDIDIALYVIDAREPVLEKYKDELAVLGLCARPVVAVLNFVASAESRERAWREALARVNLHTVLAFDAAIRDPATELALFEKLRSQLDRHRPVLDAWLAHRRDEEARRRRAALEAIAAMLIDVAALQRSVPAGGHRARRAREAMQRAVVEREQACVDTLLELYRFGREDYDEAQLPISAGRWRADPFDAETLRHYGIRASGFAAAGAGAGAAVDLGTGGLSLGAGTVTGTVLGASAGLLQSASRRWIDRARGLETLRVEDAVLRLLMARSLELLAALVARGHGNPEPIRPGLARAVDRRLPRSIRRARHHPAWSALNDGGGSGRDPAVAALADSLDELSRRAARQDADASGRSERSD